MTSNQASILGELGKVLKSRTKDFEIERVYRKTSTAMLLSRAPSWQQQKSRIPCNYILAVKEAPTTSRAIVRIVENAVDLAARRRRASQGYVAKIDKYLIMAIIHCLQPI